jgi:hypothetical protein
VNYVASWAIALCRFLAVVAWLQDGRWRGAGGVGMATHSHYHEVARIRRGNKAAGGLQVYPPPVCKGGCSSSACLSCVCVYVCVVQPKVHHPGAVHVQQYTNTAIC